MNIRLENQTPLTVLLAVAAPCLLIGLGFSLLRTSPVDAAEEIEPFRMQLARMNRSVRDIGDLETARRQSPDWREHLAAPAPSNVTVEDSPPALPVTPLFNLFLQGVGMKGTKQVAIVNDEVVELGDWIDGFEVLRIESNRVTFRDADGQTYICDVDARLRTAYPGFDAP